MKATPHTSAALGETGASYTAFDSAARGTVNPMKWVLVVVSCPCHLAILAVLLAGTSVGTFLVRNLPLATVLMSAVFVGSLLWVVRDLYRNGRVETATAKSDSCCTEPGRGKGEDS